MNSRPRSPEPIRLPVKSPPRRPRRVLVVDDYLPDARIGAGFPRAVQLMQSLAAAGARVTLLPTLGEPDAASVIRWLNPRVHVATGYGQGGIARLLAEQASPFDLIVVSRPHNMAAFRAATGRDPIVLRSVAYDAEALFAERDMLQAAVTGKPISAARQRESLRQEVALADGSRMVVTVNERSAQAFRDGGHRDVRVLGYAAGPRPTQARFAERDGFLFVGPTYHDATPNTDAVVWFVDRVLPTLRHAMARPIPLVLVGKAEAPLVAERSDGRLDVRGVVTDLTEVFARVRVFVAPTRFASGIPLKVYDAASRGVPTVLTPLLAGQLGWTHGEEVLVAETPEDFAAQCLRLHGDEQLWTHIRSRALARVARDCDPLRFRRTVAEIVSAGSGGPGR